MGSIASAGSGDIFVAFSTANPGLQSVAHEVAPVLQFPNEDLTVLFEAAVDATEEAILNALVAARDMTGVDDMKIPEYDIGVFAFANRTYAPAALVIRQASARLYDTGALKAVNKRGSDALVHIEQVVAKIYAAGSVTAEPQALTVNLLLGRSATRRDRELQALRAQLGECRARSEMDVRHALSAVLRNSCDRGTLTATALLAPVKEPSLQRLDFTASD